MTETVSVSRSIAASPAEVWGLVSDLTRMGELSPENTGGTWLKGATGPAVGARFKGTNANGKRRWTTTAKVTRCEPDTAFAFDVSVGLVSVATWAYGIEPVAEGCVVTETWTDTRGWLARSLGKPVSGVADRAEHNRAGMETTLANLAARCEGTAAP